MLLRPRPPHVCLDVRRWGAMSDVISGTRQTVGGERACRIGHHLGVVSLPRIIHHTPSCDDMRTSAMCEAARLAKSTAMTASAAGYSSMARVYASIAPAWSPAVCMRLPSSFAASAARRDVWGESGCATNGKQTNGLLGRERRTGCRRGGRTMRCTGWRLLCFVVLKTNQALKGEVCVILNFAPNAYFAAMPRTDFLKRRYKYAPSTATGTPRASASRTRELEGMCKVRDFCWRAITIPAEASASRSRCGGDAHPGRRQPHQCTWHL